MVKLDRGECDSFVLQVGVTVRTDTVASPTALQGRVYCQELQPA